MTSIVLIGRRGDPSSEGAIASLKELARHLPINLEIHMLDRGQKVEGKGAKAKGRLPIVLVDGVERDLWRVKNLFLKVIDLQKMLSYYLVIGDERNAKRVAWLLNLEGFVADYGR